MITTFGDVYRIFLSEKYIVSMIVVIIILTALARVFDVTSIGYKITILFLILSGYLFGYFIGRLTEKYSGG